MLAELIEEPMETETGKAVLEIIGAKLDTITVKIEALQSQLISSDIRMRECRVHCDTTSNDYTQRISEIEKRTLADYSAKNATDVLRKEMENQFNVLEDRRVQGSQTFWIRIGSIVAGAAILQTIVFYVIERLIR